MVPGRSAGNPGAFNPHTDDPLTKGIDLMLGRKNQLQRLICCRGCGIPLQTHDPSNVGYVRFAKYLDTWAEKTHRKIMCSRCLQLERGELVPIVKETLGPRAYSAESSEQLGFGGHVVDAEVLLRQLRIIRQRRCLVVYVMDVLDFNGAYIRNIREIAGRNPMIAIATKIDLLPPKTDLESVHNWLRYALLKKRLRVVGVNMVSNETGKGIKHAMNAIIEARHGMDVFVVGSANAGKSMFISKFLHAMEEKYPEGGLEDVERPVVSKTPGTTLGTIPLRAFRRSVTSRIFASLFDTPGVHQPTSLQNLIEIQAYNMVQPTRAFGVTTLRPAKDILAALKKSGQLASAQNVEAWLARPVRYLWGFPGQPPVACIEVVPPITTALQLSFVGCHNLSIICEANVGPSADPERGGLPEPPDGLVMNQICNIKTLEELTMEGEAAGCAVVLADVSLAGFGWVAVSMSAISQVGQGTDKDRSKADTTYVNLHRVYGLRRLKVKIAAFPMPIGGLPGKVPKPPEDPKLEEEEDEFPPDATLRLDDGESDVFDEALAVEVPPQPWAEGLGRSVGGFEMAQLGGGKGGGDVDEEAATEASGGTLRRRAKLVEAPRNLGLEEFPEDDFYEEGFGFKMSEADLDDGDLPFDDFDDEDPYSRGPSMENWGWGGDKGVENDQDETRRRSPVQLQSRSQSDDDDPFGGAWPGIPSKPAPAAGSFEAGALADKALRREARASAAATASANKAEDLRDQQSRSHGRRHAKYDDEKASTKKGSGRGSKTPSAMDERPAVEWRQMDRETSSGGKPALERGRKSEDGARPGARSGSREGTRRPSSGPGEARPAKKPSMPPAATSPAVRTSGAQAGLMRRVVRR
ncbi:unnamed protein product [Polarella glacialis]|uniref:G domain-containing protein n=2 Tax=Polarella glacialis TaxID=89957 RepID=A0A813FL94_POLGL|nr:unnamed protein product [Polarella glacialis]